MRPSAVVHLQGGLGNQLFQLSAATALGAVAGTNSVRFLNLAKSDYSPNLENVTGLRLCRAGMRDRVRVPHPDFPYHGFRRALASIARPTVTALGGRLEVTDSDFPESFDSRSVFLRGYFQSDGWFSESYRSIAKLVMNTGYRLVSGEHVVPTVVHVRRTDYLPLGWALGLSYYKNALDRLEPSLLSEGVIVVGDDGASIKQVEDYLRQHGYVIRQRPFLSSCPVMTDFWSVALAPCVVMSNSTFAWWAVAVGEVLAEQGGLDQSVVAPQPWFPAVSGDSLRLEPWATAVSTFLPAVTS